MLLCHFMLVVANPSWYEHDEYILIIQKIVNPSWYEHDCQTAMAEWLARRTPQPQDRGFESCQKPFGSSKKPSRVGYGWRQWCLGSLSRKWVPGYRQRWQLYLDYPWRLEACEGVYTPRGVEQVTNVTGLPGVIICKALWATFSQKKRYIRTAYYYYYEYILITLRIWN